VTIPVDDLMRWCEGADRRVAATKPELTFAIMFNQRGTPLCDGIKEILSSGASTYLRSAVRRAATWGERISGVSVRFAPRRQPNPRVAIGFSLLSRYNCEHSRDMRTEFAHKVAQKGCSCVVGDLTIVGEDLR
jgi:hypothetical protein